MRQAAPNAIETRSGFGYGIEAAVARHARVPTMTTLRGARASIQAIRAMIPHGCGVKSLQE